MKPAAAQHTSKLCRKSSCSYKRTRSGLCPAGSSNATNYQPWSIRQGSTVRLRPRENARCVAANPITGDQCRGEARPKLWSNNGYDDVHIQYSWCSWVVICAAKLLNLLHPTRLLTGGSCESYRKASGDLSHLWDLVDWGTHRGHIKLFLTALGTASSAFRFLWFLTFMTWPPAFTAVTRVQIPSGTPSLITCRIASFGALRLSCWIAPFFPTRAVSAVE